METLKIKKLTDTAIIPTKGSEYAAGLDLYIDPSDDMDQYLNYYYDETNTKHYHIVNGEVIMFHTGIAIELPKNTFGAIYPRSGTATKKGLVLANQTGVIDEDYRGEIIVAIRNISGKDQEIEPGERIAQLVIQNYIPVQIEETEELSETVRGLGGFGSTGR